jgi:peptidoglycan hydrolase-like protein with peptidoglycan-binding domain
MSGKLTSSVGNKGKATNRKEDVLQVQKWLNAALVPKLKPKQANPVLGSIVLGKIPPFAALAEDGVAGPTTAAAIAWFQRNVVVQDHPDGVVSQHGETLDSLETPLTEAEVAKLVADAIALPKTGSGAPISESDYQTMATDLGAEVAAVKAVAKVESGNSGFIADGRPIVRFEAHQFSKRTSHLYDASFPLISVLHRDDSLVHGGEAGLKREYTRLTMAMALDRDAALESTSWGLFQIMGFNFSTAGFGSVSAMIAAMFLTEGEQLKAFGSLIKKNGWAPYLKDKQWANFAVHYNGPDYGDYDDQMQKAYEQFSAAPKK